MMGSTSEAVEFIFWFYSIFWFIPPWRRR
jgi:hypothetical protein